MLRSYALVTAYIFFVLLANHHASADIILGYDLQGANGTIAFIAPNSTASQVSGLNLTRGAGLNASTGGVNGTNAFSATGWDSLTSTDYISFGFQVNPGFQATLNSVQFRVSAQSGGPANLGLFTSQDNFTTAVSTFDPSISVASITLSTNAVQPTTGQLELRIYALNSVGIGGGSTSPSSSVAFGNYTSGRNIELFQVNGTITAVPEPSTLVLIIAGTSIMLACRTWPRRTFRI